MFKRFQPPKASPPYPPIEEDIRCPRCGFNHDGWAFEPGYDKLCVKCGTALEGPGDAAASEEQNTERPGLVDKDAPPYEDPQAAPRDPEAAHVGACKREGRLLAGQGRYEEAVEMLEKVVAFEPNEVDAWAELGRIHYRGTGDLPRAIDCCRKALEIDEDLVSVKCDLCLALLFDGQYDLAKKGLLEVIRTVRNSRGHDEEFRENGKALLHDCLGELYVSKKQASGERLTHIKDIIELLEIEKIYFH